MSLETNAEIYAGYTVKKMIEDILLQDRGNGLPTDPKSPIIDFDTREIKLGEQIDLTSGAFLGDMLIDLANTVRCRIFYDNNGRLIFNKTDSDFEFKSKAATWVFDDSSDIELLSSDMDYNFSSVKNRITVWGEDMDGASYVATVTDDSPKSPVRVSKVGYRVAPTIENMFGYNQENVDAYAKNYLLMKSILGLSIKLECTMIPHLNVEDVVQIRSKKLGISDERFLISEISYHGGKVTLSVTNIDYLPQFEEFSE